MILVYSIRLLNRHLTSQKRANILGSFEIEVYEDPLKCCKAREIIDGEPFLVQKRLSSEIGPRRKKRTNKKKNAEELNQKSGSIQTLLPSNLGTDLAGSNPQLWNQDTSVNRNDLNSEFDGLGTTDGYSYLGSVPRLLSSVPLSVNTQNETVTRRCLAYQAELIKTIDLEDGWRAAFFRRGDVAMNNLKEEKGPGFDEIELKRELIQMECAKKIHLRI